MEKGEKQGRRRYTQEFKLEAVRLVRTGIAKARVARDLGIHLSVLMTPLRRWGMTALRKPPKLDIRSKRRLKLCSCGKLALLGLSYWRPSA